MPEEIYIEQKKERVGDVFFGVTSFYAKKSEKRKLVGEDKKSESLRLLQMFLNYVLNDIEPLIKEIFVFLKIGC